MNKQTLINYVLQYNINQAITHLKLQKLLYYIKVWSLVAERPLYEGVFHHWHYGPVDKQVYHQYKHYGRGPIPMPETYAIIPKPDGEMLLDFILVAYMPHSAYTLSAMSHQELPWLNTPQDTIISDESILSYYQKHHFVRNFKPFDPEHKPFYLVKSNSWYAFTMDMSAEDAKSCESYSSFANYKQHMAQAQQEIQQTMQNIAW